MGLFNKRKLLDMADKLGDISGAASKILIDKTVEAARTTDQVIGRFGTSFQSSLNKSPSSSSSPHKPSPPKALEAPKSWPPQTTVTKQFCKGKNCTQDATTVEGFCTNHQREHDQHRTRMCGTKMKFPTLEEARLHAADLSAKSGKNYTGYPCSFCDYFHFGTSKLGSSLDQRDTYDS